MKAISARSRTVNFGLALLGAVASAAASPPVIDVVYPRAPELDSNVVIADVDSNFVFGSVRPPESRLTINGIPVKIYNTGAFLAFLVVPKSDQTYRLRAEYNGDKADTSVTFQFPGQLPSDTTEAPVIACPTLIRFLPGYNVTRTAVDGAYDLFPIEDTRCVALSQEKNYLRVRLTSSRYTWVEPRFVETLSGATDQSPTPIYKIVCQSESGATRISIPDVSRPLFRLEDLLSPSEIRLTLYGVVSHIDLVQMRYDDPILDRLIWEQVEDGVTTIHLYLKHPSWGYSAQWNQNDLEIVLRHPPDFEQGLECVTVAIDAGHGGEQDGAISPTRLLEKNLNLTLADLLQERLTQDGFQAILIRNDDETLGLYDRIDRARKSGASLLISIHHNAFPDGVNPFAKPYGTGTYYYHPQSLDLARLVHEYLLQGTKLPDDGLQYDNLALVRPTDMPAILIEIGHMILPDQETFLQDAAFQKRCVAAISRGIKSFVNARRKGM